MRKPLIGGIYGVLYWHEWRKRLKNYGTGTSKSIIDETVPFFLL